MGGYKEYAVAVPEHCEVNITRLTVLGESRDTLVADMHRLIDEFAPDCLMIINMPETFPSTVRTPINC